MSEPMTLLYDFLLWANVGICIATAIIYVISSLRSESMFRLFKASIALSMVSTVFVYSQLAVPGDFLSSPGMDAFLVRVNFSVIILVLFMSGLIGMTRKKDLHE